jgi:hypothetical protein
VALLEQHLEFQVVELRVDPQLGAPFARSEECDLLMEIVGVVAERDR